MHRALALVGLLSACVICPPRTGLLDIPKVKPIAPPTAWHTWADELVQCTHRPPLVPFDSIAWYLAPAGIPTNFSPGAQPMSCVGGLTYTALKAVVISGFCAGGTREIVVHELGHVMYNSPMLTANFRGYFHDRRVFNGKCGLQPLDHDA